MRIDITRLPKLAEYYETPYVVYEKDNVGIRAINDFASESGLLPEILFEGEEISRERFAELAVKRAKGSSKYNEVLDFYDNLK